MPSGWEEGIARLRARTGVAAALAAAGVLAAARPRWAALVDVHTAGNDLLLTRRGETYPFGADVRVSLVGRAYEVRRSAHGAIVARTEIGPHDIDAVVADYLVALTGATEVADPAGVPAGHRQAPSSDAGGGQQTVPEAVADGSGSGAAQER